MFPFKAKQADVLSHWYAPIPNFSYSTPEFYAAIEEELRAQKVPGLEMSRLEFAEGGVLSDKRIYLRMMRERLVIDVCAAPFGTNYFFSCRFAALPAKVSLIAIATVLFAMFGVAYFSVNVLGFWMSLILVPLLLIGLLFTLRNTVSLGLNDLDSWLLRQPLLGPLYERFFREETYYRHDTRLMYLSVVEGVVKMLVEQETAAKGIKLLTQYEHAPLLNDLYRKSEKRLDEQLQEAV